MSTNSNPLGQRSLAWVFALCALATVALLSDHPAGGGHTFTEVLQAEAHNQVTDGVVHGGFIVISAVLVASLLGLARILGSARMTVTMGLVAFCVGAGALMMSMGLDGLVIPAIAARCLRENTPASLASAQTLFLFCGTCIKFLMPIGLLFECAAMLSYSVVIITHRWVWTGWIGILAGSVVLSVCLLFGFGTVLVIGGMLALCVWYLGVAVMLWVAESPVTGTDVISHRAEPSRPA